MQAQLPQRLLQGGPFRLGQAWRQRGLDGLRHRSDTGKGCRALPGQAQQAATAIVRIVRLPQQPPAHQTRRRSADFDFIHGRSFTRRRRRQDAIPSDRGEQPQFRHRKIGMNKMVPSNQMRHRFGGDGQAVW